MADVFAGALIVSALAVALLATFGPDDDGDDSDDDSDADTAIIVDDHESSFPI